MRKDVYIIENGSVLSISNENLVVKRKEQKIGQIPLLNIKQLIIKGRSTVNTYLVQKLLNEGIDIVFLTFTGNFIAKIPSCLGKNVELRRKQYRFFENKELRNQLASSFVKGKIWNSYILMKRYMDKHKDSNCLNRLWFLYNQLDANVYNSSTLMGKEGIASKSYFSALGKTFKKINLGYLFTGRSRRPPKDPVNAMLSFGYTLLFNEVKTIVEHTGLDPYLGFLHLPEYGRPSLALDIMEEFRPVIVDILILSLVSKKIIKIEDFQEIDDEDVENDGGDGVYFKKDKLNLFIHHFKNRMETVVFCIKTGKELCYRDIIRNQVYELIRCLETGNDYKPYRILK